MRAPMRAIEFNTWMTLLSMTSKIACSSIDNEYIVVPNGNILPEYPRDLTGFKKPSIIIQKVASDVSATCFNHGFIGQVFDNTQNARVDINSRKHEMEFQYDVFGDTNTQNSMLESLIVDKILDSGKDITIYDFVGNVKHPTPMGVATLTDNLDIVPLDSTKEYNYRTAIRFYLRVIQTIVPKQEFVDLSKWIKISQIVTI